jgi:diacylglycerol kinase (ATP)
MQQPGSLKFLFVVNPISGGSPKQGLITLVSDYFAALPHSVEFYLLTGKNDTVSLAHWIKDFQPDRVVAVGGDGTISLVAKHLTGTSMALGILPSGSANGLARELLIPEQVMSALDIIVNGTIKKTDVISVNGHLCVHLSDIGMNAQLVKYFEEGNWRGKLGYARVALKVWMRRKYMQVIIETPDMLIERNAFMVVVANASKYGFGAVINPEGDMFDGLFEVIIIRKLAVSEMFKMWFRPQPFNPDKIEVYHAKSININTHKKVHFQVDGEYLGRVKEVKATIEQGMLNILFPSQAV